MSGSQSPARGEVPTVGSSSSRAGGVLLQGPFGHFCSPGKVELGTAPRCDRDRRRDAKNDSMSCSRNRLQTAAKIFCEKIASFLHRLSDRVRAHKRKKQRASKKMSSRRQKTIQHAGLDCQVSPAGYEATRTRSYRATQPDRNMTGCCGGVSMTLQRKRTAETNKT